MVCLIFLIRIDLRLICLPDLPEQDWSGLKGVPDLAEQDFCSCSEKLSKSSCLINPAQAIRK